MASLHLRPMAGFPLYRSMDHCSGSNASVAQRTVEGHGFSKAKGIVFGIIVF